MSIFGVYIRCVYNKEVIFMRYVKDIIVDQFISHQKRNVPVSDTHSNAYAQSILLPRFKVIKRYRNRKFYDIQRSCYISLDDIINFIRSSKNKIVIIDNDTKIDITASIFTQIILKVENKNRRYIPTSILSEMICNYDGSLSNYLAKKLDLPQKTKKESPVSKHICDFINKRKLCSYSKTKTVQNNSLKEKAT